MAGACGAYDRRREDELFAPHLQSINDQLFEGMGPETFARFSEIVDHMSRTSDRATTWRRCWRGMITTQEKTSLMRWGAKRHERCHGDFRCLKRANNAESLRDGRRVYIGDELVEDVTTHPAFRNAAQSFAMIYDRNEIRKT